MQPRSSAASAVAVLSTLVLSLLVVAIGAAAPPASAQDARPVSQILRDAERAALRVQHLLASVRGIEARDRVACVDAQLSQIHSTVRLALQRQQHLTAAERRGETERVARERALVGRLGDDVRRLELQARACIDPEPPLPSGVTQLTVIIEPWVPELDLSVPAVPAR